MKLKPSYIVPILLGLTACVGLFLRAYKLGETSLWIDEAYTLNAAHATLAEGYPLLPSGKVYSNGFLESYVTALSLAALPFDPQDPWSARLPSVAFGTAAIIAIFFLARSLWGSERFALTVALVMSLSEWEILWSRQVRGYAMLAFLVILLLYLLWRYVETSEKKYALGALPVLALAALSHNSGTSFIPAVLVFFLAQRFFRQEMPLKQRVIGILAFTLGAAAISLCALKALSIPSSHFTLRYLGFFAGELALFSLGSMLAFVPGIFQKKDSRGLMFLGLFLVLPFFYILATAPSTQFRYIFPFFPLMVLLASYSLWRIGQIIFDRLPRARKEAASIVLVILFALPSLVLIPKAFYSLERGTPQPSWADAYRFVEKNMGTGDAVVTSYAAMNVVFLGQPGLWLQMPMNSIPTDDTKWNVGGRDWYAGAPAIESIAALKRLKSERHGFIVLNYTMRTRRPDIYAFIKGDRSFRLAYRALAPDLMDAIEVYRF